ncbi:PAS domain-containing protein [Clostridium estertheticum]|uniref:ATP-binding protein n=1 Tax=Clostridium estertheticum TaxID=238834 RepID=UPI001CF36C6A|nr:ATP-binding protein [Clostridium estertheticum]MCB2305211.1 PAS domain-containing protein [Clostridium estertheticum]MCB2343519.1 PAS domain-containing protein [Clostridium estertheticum]MCB2348439.1 PAS domain-containing protein [Clostridium estertheticum]WAG47387.1 PAS domain-containing protein [Clostridium estertheticum]
MKNIMPSISLACTDHNIGKNGYINKYEIEKILNEKIMRLEDELQHTKECLQLSNEEHLVYNEELLSANEEFKAVNDELLKINTQYQYKNQELLDLYSDMTNYLNSTDIGTIFLDEKLCIRKFTPSITKEINLKVQDIGRPMHDISNNLINDDLNIGAIEVLSSHMLYEKEIESKNGSWYLLKCAPYCTFDNLIKGVVLSLVDITNKKLLDETILSETLKTEFFSNLSHELRTPLNIILCTLQLLDTYTISSEVNDKETKFKQYIGIMKQNCYRQLRLVNNMIDITKLDASFFDLNLQNCNIVNVVESVTMSVAEYIKTKSIKLIFDTDIEECIMSCDPEKIERVILNLLSNSIKFTRSGGSMKVNMYDKGKNIIISIKDTGIGIPPDKLNIIFDRFRQVDRSLTRKQEGSGIGLSIVKSLVELHGGTISVRSEYGKETEFIIVLPIIVLPKDNDTFEVFESESQERIERIHIEFSDIYSLN